MGKNVVPLFLDNHLDFFAEAGDKVIFKKGPGNAVDGPILRLAFGMLNKAISDDVPDEFKAEFHEAMDLVVLGDYDDAGAEAIDVAVLLVAKANFNQNVKEIAVGILNIAKGALASLD